MSNTKTMNNTNPSTRNCFYERLPELSQYYGFAHFAIGVLAFLLGPTVGVVQAQQTGTIEGAVTESGTGEAIPGANIIVVNFAKGAATNAQGEYTITDLEPGTYTLQASFIGYGQESEEGVEVRAGETTTVDFVMQQELAGLDEVVVVGYSEQQRKDLTGAVSSVPVQDLEGSPINTVDQVLKGQMAGVRVQEVTGAPGGGTTVQIRGAGSISAGNEPLYVIDGFPVSPGFNQDSNPLGSISPSDIQSVDVLKDASATAIYGSRGANGVVIITTKRGTEGETQVTFNTRYGVQEVAHKVDVLNAQEFAQAVIEARTNAFIDDGGDPSVPLEDREGGPFAIPDELLDPSALGEGTDWQDEVFRRSPEQNYQLAVRGGSESVRYYVSGAYLNQQGIIVDSDFQRFSLRSNIDAELSERARLGLRLSPSYSTRNIIQAGGNLGDAVVRAATSALPIFPVRNADGSYNFENSNFASGFAPLTNPVARAREVDDVRTEMRLQGTVFTEYDLTDHLLFKATLGADFDSERRNYFRPSTMSNGRTLPPTNPVGLSGTWQGINWLSETTLTYDRIFGGHSLNVLLGATAQEETNERTAIEATDFPNDFVPTLNAGQATYGASFKTQWALLSLLGRVDYSYRSKYLLTLTVRRDGSSRFGEHNRWGTFPSVALAWRISEEPFMESLSLISNLKARASYGQAGNFSIPNYASLSLITGVDAILGPGLGERVNGLAPSAFSNSDLSWETSEQVDVGLDLGLFGNRISLTADYYRKVSTDLLLNVQIPAASGFTNAFQNIGKVLNHGFELGVNTENITGDFRWDTRFNISFNRNEVLELGSEGDPIFGVGLGAKNTHITQIGDPMGSYYGLEVIGIYQTEEEVENNPSFVDSDTRYSRPGDFRFRDVNGDGKITFGEDRTVIGDPYPDFTFGLTNSFGYKNFQLRFLIDGAYGFEVFNANAETTGNFATNTNLYQSALDGRFISVDEPGDGETPRLNRRPAGLNNNISSRFVEDASFMRFRNITLSYQMPSAFLETIALNSTRLYFTIHNAYTLTEYQGYNPEVSEDAGNSLTPGIDYGAYPVARSFTLGMNLGF